MTMDSKEKQTQVDKFREKAKELETDDDEKRYDRLVKKIATEKEHKES